MKLFKTLKQNWKHFLECKARKKQYKFALQELHKEFKHLKSDPKNNTWKQDWLPFIKYNCNWDWEYLYDIIIYKLKLFKIHFSVYNVCNEEWVEQTNKEIDEVLELGNYIHEHDYTETSHKFMLEHIIPTIHIYKRAEDEGYFQQNTYVKSNLIHTVYGNIGRWGVGLLEMENLILRDKEADEWCKANGYNPRKDVRYAYSSEWDSEESQQTYKKLTEQAIKEEQADWDKFFLLISKYFRGWWD